MGKVSGEPSADIDKAEATWLWSIAPRRSKENRLTPTIGEAEIMLAERETERCDPLLASWMKSTQFKGVFAVQHRRTLHINVQETRTVNIWARRMVRVRRNWRLRQILFLDSKVTISGATKGRSSSRVLNHLLKKRLGTIGPSWPGQRASSCSRPGHLVS